MLNTTIKATRGDTINIPIVATMKIGAIYRCQLRKTPASVLFLVLAIVDGNIYISPAQSDPLVQSTYYVELEENDGGVVTTIQRTSLMIKEDYTQTYGEAPLPAWVTDETIEVAEMTTRHLYIRKVNNSLVNVETVAAQTELATIAANAAAQSVNTSILNATTATDTANASALNADQKATLANDAATLANQKAALADASALNADTKATLADQKATLANAAALNADTKAGLATTATGLADTAALNANTKATLADQKATLADQKATLANTAAGNADAAATLANTATGFANTATTQANTARDAANAAAAAANAAAAAAEAEPAARIAADNAINANIEILKLFSYSRNLYGCEFLKGSLDPNSIRWIGDEKFKTNHYILNQFKAAKVKDGVVTGILNQTNWMKMEDGTASNIIIDGTVIVDDGSDIMYVNTKGFYAINGGKNATYERRLLSDSPFTYDGEQAVYVKPFGMCVDYSVVKASKQRSIRDNSFAGTGGAGIGVGMSYLADGKGSPTTSVSRFNYELYARNKNTDVTKNTPYANNFTFDLNVWATLLFVKFQTKDLHAESVLGKCISSNDSAPTLANWGTNTGVRVTETGGTYSYYLLSSGRFRAAIDGTNANFFQLINNYRPLLKMFEMQLALSYAKENNIAVNTQFTYDGSTYSYVNVTGSNGLAQGEMTARVRKFVTFSFTGYDGVNNIEVNNMVIDYVLSQAIVCGKIAGWGNCYVWNSGVDMVCDANNANLYTIFQTDDVTKLTIDSDAVDKDPGVKFAFENTYTEIGTHANTNVYNLAMFDNSVMGKTAGGGLHTAECTYSYYGGTATAGKRSRKGVFFGGLAYLTSCALRLGLATLAPTTTLTSLAGGFRVSLP